MKFENNVMNRNDNNIENYKLSDTDLFINACY